MNWTDKENNFLRKAYNNEPISKIARALMRSEQAVRNHVFSLRKKGFAFDRVRDVTERTVSEKLQDDLEPIIHQSHTTAVFEVEANANMTYEGGPVWHPTEFDESDDIEAAKKMQNDRINKDNRRRMLWKSIIEDA
tara:strand:- start:38 stop:445 length:408 start_codon:yes stop_codon:yes gene_type:complete